MARRWKLSWLRRGGLVLVTAWVLEYLVLPQITGARAALDQLSRVSPGYLALGLGLEAGSLFAYSRLTHCVLPPADRPTYFTVLRIDISALGLSHVVPGGGATASALRYRLLTVAGVRPADELSATTIQGTGIAATLGLVFVAGVLLALPTANDDPDFLVAGAIAAVVVACVVAAAAVLLRNESRAVAAAGALVAHLPGRLGARADGARHLVGSLAERLRALGQDRRLMRDAIVWASANWILDAAALWVFLRAFGATEGLQGLLLGYGLAGILALLPLTPGGLGLVEGALVSVLLAFGTPQAQALLGVITWRLAEFWLPIPLAALAYLSLRSGVLRPSRLPRRPFIPRADALPLDTLPDTNPTNPRSSRPG